MELTLDFVRNGLLTDRIARAFNEFRTAFSEYAEYDTPESLMAMIDFIRNTAKISILRGSSWCRAFHACQRWDLLKRKDAQPLCN